LATAFARSAHRIPFVHDKLKKVAGDARKAEADRAALKGAEAVIQAFGIPSDARMLIGPVDLFSAITATLMPLTQEAGLPRLICATCFGAGESR
jgi:hypothetical protein